jgi:hypothetical protein
MESSKEQRVSLLLPVFPRPLSGIIADYSLETILISIGEGKCSLSKKTALDGTRLEPLPYPAWTLGWRPKLFWSETEETFFVLSEVQSIWQCYRFVPQDRQWSVLDGLTCAGEPGETANAISFLGTVYLFSSKRPKTAAVFGLKDTTSRKKHFPKLLANCARVSFCGQGARVYFSGGQEHATTPGGILIRRDCCVLDLVTQDVTKLPDLLVSRCDHISFICASHLVIGFGESGEFEQKRKGKRTFKTKASSSIHILALRMPLSQQIWKVLQLPLEYNRQWQPSAFASLNDRIYLCQKQNAWEWDLDPKTPESHSRRWERVSHIQTTHRNCTVEVDESLFRMSGT